MTEKEKIWRVNNKEHLREYNKKWAKDNKEHRSNKDLEWRRANRERLYKLAKIWRENNKHRYKEYNRRGRVKRRDYQLQKYHGINTAQYNEMFVKQDGKCAICGTHKSELSYNLYVDHNHQTNKNRGLLCRPCNSGIGFLRESISILESAINYLMTHA